ncbi:hypothetical protein HZH66_009449 [Vespula vulgaris]|uniref:Small ribosomal subunit protein mS35 mitochondrial conserved domain-containing protein n=1 Tax=Vespula vulgaris TaxID=7454 RepID=A0A834JMJ9_VESVU|nr:hypothetical protein HZH66_009449 [Vespula vulgaris]
MSIIIRRYKKNIIFPLSKVFNSTSTSDETDKKTTAKEFRVLELMPQRNKINVVKKQESSNIHSRCDDMSIDQDWPSIWSGARSFNPNIVPLPLRQGYVKGKRVPPSKYGNAELLKIPNFLHLTPPAIKRHCEVLKQFCTSWPKELDTDEKCNQHFPLDIITSDYCYSSPTIREPLARIVSLKVNLNSLTLDSHAKDKLLRLVGNKYNPETNIITITADRCPTRKQNLEYIEYLLVALFHESWHTEAWEAEKSEADMEYYDWDKSKSRQNFIALHSWPDSSTDIDIETIPSVREYKIAVSELINQGEDQYSLNKYKEAVKNNRMLRIVILIVLELSCFIVNSKEESHISYLPKNVNNQNLRFSAVHDPPSCKNLAVCYLNEMFDTSYRRKSDIHSPSIQKEYGKKETNLQARSYYNGFGAPATATYYPTFDPISVLASLAFLAFLLQSFASLFDHSRSIVPTMINSRESSTQLKNVGITRRILHVSDDYENLN